MDALRRPHRLTPPWIEKEPGESLDDRRGADQPHEQHKRGIGPTRHVDERLRQLWREGIPAQNRVHHELLGGQKQEHGERDRPGARQSERTNAKPEHDQPREEREYQKEQVVEHEESPGAELARAGLEDLRHVAILERPGRRIELKTVHAANPPKLLYLLFGAFNSS